MWIKAIKQRPDKSGDYICATDNGSILNLHYDIVADAFNVHFYPYRTVEDNYSTELAVKYWQSIEELPEDFEETEAHYKYGYYKEKT